MLCPRCNKELLSNGLCSVCGTQVDTGLKGMGIFAIPSSCYANKSNMEYRYQQGRIQGLRNRIIMDMSIITLISLVFAVIIITFFASYVDKVMSAIEKGDSESAKSLYTNKILDNSDQSKLLFNELDDYLAGIIRSFNNGEIEDTTVVRRFNTVRDGIVSGYGNYKKYEKEYMDLKESKNSYEEGNQYYDAGNYEKAINKYMSVLESDTKYDNAQNKIDAAKAKFKYELLEMMSVIASADKEGYEETISKVKYQLNNGVYGEDAEVRSKYTQFVDKYITLVSDQCRSLEESNDYLGVYEMVSNAKAVVGDKNAKLDDLFKKAEEGVRNQGLMNAEQKVSKGKYVDAVNILLDTLEYDNGKDVVGSIRSLVSAMDKLISN